MHDAEPGPLRATLIAHVCKVVLPGDFLSIEAGSIPARISFPRAATLLATFTLYDFYLNVSDIITLQCLPRLHQAFISAISSRVLDAALNV